MNSGIFLSSLLKTKVVVCTGGNVRIWGFSDRIWGVSGK